METQTHLAYLPPVNRSHKRKPTGPLRTSHAHFLPKGAGALTKLSLTLSSLLFLLTSGRAATYHVAVTGSDGNTGTVDQPFQTISHAQRKALPGDTVYIRAGTYPPIDFESGSIRSGTATSPIAYRAYPGEKPVIQGLSGGEKGDAIFLYNKNYIIIDGLTTRSGDRGIHIDGREGLGLGMYNQILNCDVSQGHVNGVSIGYGAKYNLIRGCRVYNNSQQNWPRDLIGGWGGGVSIHNQSPGNTVENCFIYFNHGEGLGANVGANGAVLRHNVVSDNWSANIYIQGAKDVLVDGNLVYVTEEVKNFTPYYEDNYSPGIILAIEGNRQYNPELSGHRIINNIVINAKDGVRSYGPWGMDDPNWHRRYSNWLVANNTFLKCERGIFLEGVDGIEEFTVKNNVVIGISDSRLAWYPHVAGSMYLGNNVYCGNTRRYIWNGSQVQDLGSWSILSGEKNSIEFSSGMAPNLIESPDSVPPRLWSLPGLPSPVDINSVTLKSLASPYQLKSGSPAVDTGATLSNVATDLASTSRPQGAHFDVGAFEATAGSPITKTNTPPTLSTIPNQTTTLNIPTGAIGFTVGDAETPVESLSVLGSSSNPTLVSNSQIQCGGSGANRNVTITPATDQSGVATISISVVDGSLVTTKIFTLTVTAPSLTGFAWEAEAAGLSSPMSVASDSTASQGKYISSSSTGQGTVTSTVNITTAGEYLLWCRVNAGVESNSFYVSVDGGAEDVFDIPSPYDIWQWSRLRGRSSGSPRKLNLSAGTHRIVFRAREAGAKLDRFEITNDPNYVPSSNTTDTNTKTTLAWEAEAAALGSPMSISSDSTASQGKYISSSSTGQGTVTSTVNITTAGEYLLWCRVNAGVESNSFYVSVDGGAEDVFDIPSPYDIWQWSRLRGRSSGSPRKLNLSAGTHRIVFRAREAGAKLDRLEITNDPNYVPSSSTDTITDITLAWEAEAAALISPMSISSDSTASQGKYISSSSPGQGTVTSTINITTAGEYLLWCRVNAGIESNSFYVSVDGGAEDVYDIPSPYDTWQWCRLRGRNSGNPRKLNLSAGTHRIVYRTREAGAKLDQFVITNNPQFDPGH